MGNGRFVDGKLNFVVSADFTPTAAQKTDIQTGLTSASDLLHEITGGQVQFGDVYMTDNNSGLVDAEIVFLQAGDLSGGSRGQFGIPNVWAKITRADRTQKGVIAHEMSHHVWNLGDEYSGPMERFELNKSNPAPDEKTIPIRNGPPPNEWAGQEAILRFGGVTDVRKAIVSNTSTQIVVVDPGYPALPTSSSIDYGYHQDTRLECGRPSESGVRFCLMEDAYTPGVVEFCHENNHNTVLDTDQQVLHQQSCWETIVSTPGFTSLRVPDTTPAPPEPVHFIDIVRENRIVLVIDCSGSMSGDKLVYAKEGVKYWLDERTSPEDLLSIITFNTNFDVLLPITAVSEVADIATVENDLDAIEADGETNIRDAIREGVAQITSLANRAVSQAVVILTDGKHNEPDGTRLTEALLDLLANGVKAITIAIGDAGSVDASDLEEIAFESGGILQLVGLSDPIDIETALIHADQFVRGGLADANSFDFVPSPPMYKEADVLLKPIYDRERFPLFTEVMRALRIKITKIGRPQAFLPFQDLFKTRRVYAERGCSSFNFSINYDLEANFDLFLIDPTGSPVVPDGLSIVKIGNKSHKIVKVRNPRMGQWSVIILARQLLTGKTSTVNLTVGAENRRLVTTGGSSRSVYEIGESARLFAHASWESRLTELKVSATLRSSAGDIYISKLSDGGPLSKTAGNYTAEIADLKVGQYRGVITIQGKSRNVRADARHRLAHSKAASLRARSSAPKFQRVVPFNFEVVKKRTI